MPRAHVFTHTESEGPSRIGDACRRLGIDVVVYPLFADTRLPGTIPAGDVLVVMGGPMGVGDLGDPRYPFLAPEVDFLRRHVGAERPVLGICLGAQLLARALGARVYPLTVGEPPLRHREVGWGAVTFTRSAAEEPVLAGLDESEMVLHWHGDTFGLPEGAIRLAGSLACPNQMFRHGRSFGLQFHVEITADDVTTWVRDDAAFVCLANGAEGGARILADTARHMPRHQRVGDQLIENLLRTMLA